MVFYVKLFWRENSKTRFAGKECDIILKIGFGAKIQIMEKIEIKEDFSKNVLN